MTVARFPRRGLRAVPCFVLASGLLVAAAGGVEAAPLFKLADDSSVIVRGTVERVVAYPKAKLRVLTIRSERVLKGDVPANTPIELAQEMLFESTRPYFERGTRTLVFAVPLPDYTLFRQVLPAGSYLRWTERLDTAAEVAALSDPGLVEPVARSLALRDDPEATARHLAGLLAAPSPRLRADALAAIEARRELAPLLDATALEPVRAFLADERVPAAERAEVLVRLARAGAAGSGPLAEEVAARGGPLEAAAVDALVSSGRLPPEERLLAYASSGDPALRIAAVRGLARGASPRALDRVAAMASSDPSEDVRVAAIQALGASQSERAVPVLADVLRRGEKRQSNAAAEALGRLASPSAIAALAEVLEHGTLDAQGAAAFALGRTGKVEAAKILREQEEEHPDPRVRKLCTLALGEGKHER